MKILVSITDKNLNKTLLTNVDYCSYSLDGRLTIAVEKNNLTQEIDESFKQYENWRSESYNFVRIQLKVKVSKSSFVTVDRKGEIILYSFYL